MNAWTIAAKLEEAPFRLLANVTSDTTLTCRKILIRIRNDGRIHVPAQARKFGTNGIGSQDYYCDDAMQLKIYMFARKKRYGTDTECRHFIISALQYIGMKIKIQHESSDRINFSASYNKITMHYSMFENYIRSTIDDKRTLQEFARWNLNKEYLNKFIGITLEDKIQDLQQTQTQYYTLFPALAKRYPIYFMGKDMYVRGKQLWSIKRRAKKFAVLDRHYTIKDILKYLPQPIYEEIRLQICD